MRREAVSPRLQPGIEVSRDDQVDSSVLVLSHTAIEVTQELFELVDGRGMATVNAHCAAHSHRHVPVAESEFPAEDAHIGPT